jgi:hypothetical protein
LLRVCETTGGAADTRHERGPRRFAGSFFGSRCHSFNRSGKIAGDDEWKT